jgi:Cu/Ag efflux pump CusA
MDEETMKAGYRKVFVTLVGLIIAVIAVLWPTNSDQANMLGAIAINLGLPVVDAVIVIVYNWLNVKQKKQLADANVARIDATTEQLKVLAANPTLVNTIKTEVSNGIS